MQILHSAPVLELGLNALPTLAGAAMGMGGAMMSDNVPRAPAWHCYRQSLIFPILQ
jgi:hypothetical protein